MKNILFILLFSPILSNAQLVRTTPSGVNPLTESTYVNITGDVMSGPLQTTSLTASSGTFTGNAQVNGSAFSVGGSTLVVANGRVGIGVASPLTALQVSGIGATTFITDTTGVGAGTGGILGLGGIYTGTSLTTYAQVIGSKSTATDGVYSGNMILKTNNGSGLVENVIIPAAAVTTGGALCLNASHILSKCTSAIDGSGNCTCP